MKTAYECKREGVREDWSDCTPATIVRLGLDALFGALDAACLDARYVTITYRFGNPFTYRRKIDGTPVPDAS